LSGSERAEKNDVVGLYNGNSKKLLTPSVTKSLS